MMVGLSVVLEAQKFGVCDKKTPQVINKTTMMLNKPSPSAVSPLNYSHHSAFEAPSFLDQCFLCRKKLLPGKDIYMYKGDKGFCSVECRCKQIFMDEEESIHKEICSLAAMKKSTPSTSSSSSSTAPRHHRKGPRNRAGGFAY